MEKSELSKKINEVYAELGELKTKENMILDEGKKEDSDIKDQILKLKNLSSDLEVLESDLGEFINVNKIFAEKCIEGVTANEEKIKSELDLDKPIVF